MMIGIKVVCAPAFWPKMATRLQLLQENLFVELNLPG